MFFFFFSRFHEWKLFNFRYFFVDFTLQFKHFHYGWIWNSIKPWYAFEFSVLKWSSGWFIQLIIYQIGFFSLLFWVTECSKNFAFHSHCTSFFINFMLHSSFTYLHTICSTKNINNSYSSTDYIKLLSRHRFLHNKNSGRFQWTEIEKWCWDKICCFQVRNVFGKFFENLSGNFVEIDLFISFWILKYILENLRRKCVFRGENCFVSTCGWICLISTLNVDLLLSWKQILKFWNLFI